MKESKKLAVAALENGTVIDHLPCGTVYKVVRILGLDRTKYSVTIGDNLPSNKLGLKGIIKVANTEFDEAAINRIAVIAPNAVINTIRNYEVVSKKKVCLPPVLVGVVRCANPKCITNNEPMPTRFNVQPDQTLRCHYCNHPLNCADADIL